MNLNRRELLASVAALAGIDCPTPSETVPFQTQCARWHCELNCWRWPADWGEPPEWAREKLKRSGKERHLYAKDLYRPIMDALSILAGAKEVSRVWNLEVHQNFDSQEQFEQWWADRAELDREEYFQKWYTNRARA